MLGPLGPDKKQDGHHSTFPECPSTIDVVDQHCYRLFADNMLSKQEATQLLIAGQTPPPLLGWERAKNGSKETHLPPKKPGK
jgi:hypothetical protein